MFDRIIVAVDGSATSNAALGVAVLFAKQRQSILHIVHVIDVVNFSAETANAFGEYEAALRDAGNATLARAKSVVEASGLTCDTKLLEVGTISDRIADEIAREAKNWRAELIVIGTHGRRGLRRLVLGSVAESIVRITPTPLLLIPSK